MAAINRSTDMTTGSIWKRTIGAVFDFFAGTVQRAPQWWQRNGLEWAYRLLKEPKRMWRRYIIGNVLFLWNILKEKNGMIMDHN